MTLWLLGKLRLYDGASHIWKWPVALAPLGGAVWIGITRLQVTLSARCERPSEADFHVQSQAFIGPD